MPKTVINLVKELGAKNTHEVLELLVQVGFDTKVEGFGVMSKVDDSTITKVMALKGKAAEAPAKAGGAKRASAKAATEEAPEAPAAETARTRPKPITEPASVSA